MAIALATGGRVQVDPGRPAHEVWLGRPRPRRPVGPVTLFRGGPGYAWWRPNPKAHPVLVSLERQRRKALKRRMTSRQYRKLRKSLNRMGARPAPAVQNVRVAA